MADAVFTHLVGSRFFLNMEVDADEHLPPLLQAGVEVSASIRFERPAHNPPSNTPPGTPFEAELERHIDIENQRVAVWADIPAQEHWPAGRAYIRLVFTPPEVAPDLVGPGNTSGVGGGGLSLEDVFGENNAFVTESIVVDVRR